MPRPRKTPQQKKRDSYAKDRRSASAKIAARGSRRAIASRKRRPHRADRRRAHQTLAGAVGAPEEAILDQLESRVDKKRPKPLKKAPREPLGKVVEAKLARRAQLGVMTLEGAAAKVARIHRLVRRKG